MTIEREQGVGHWRLDRHLGMIVDARGAPVVGEAAWALAAAAPALLEALKKARNTLAGCGKPKIAADICDAAIALASSDGKGSDNG